jgi:hypothetical protein
MPKPIVPERTEDGTPLTQPAEKPPRTHHSKYEYEHGEFRKCHLCGSKQDHMLYQSEEIWFANLQDRAKHILECHRNNPIECERAAIILGYEALWNQYSEKKDVEITPSILTRNPFKKQQQPYEQQYAQQKEPPKFKQPLLTKKKIGMFVLVCIILYGIYVMYLLSQGYTF